MTSYSMTGPVVRDRWLQLSVALPARACHRVGRAILALAQVRTAARPRERDR